MRKCLPFALVMLFVWSISCNEEAPVLKENEPKITITDIDHEPGVQELLSKIKTGSPNGRVSSLEINGAFFKYEDLDSGTLNYTFLLPDDSPDYFENLVLSKYDEGFYGYIYRYIPDGIQSTDESFRGSIEQFDLEGEQIGEFPIPFIRDSIPVNGRVQLLNQCVKSIEQNCVTTYKVESVTDYPCHCQYDRKTKLGSVCTFSFNMDMCDDMIAIPPAGGGGTYVGAGNGPSPLAGGGGSGSGGNSTVALKPATKKPIVVYVPENDLYVGDKCVACIENYLKDPCLKMVAKKVLDPTLASMLNRLIQDIFGKNDKVNLTLIDDLNPSLDALGKTDRPTNKNGVLNIVIHLNQSRLLSRSTEIAAATIYHEAFHALILYYDASSNFTASEHHILIFDTYLELLSNALRKAYPTLPPRDATGLILVGATTDGPGSIKEKNPELAKEIITRKGFNEDELTIIFDRYKKNISGTPCDKD